MLIAHHFNGLKDDPALDKLKDPGRSINTSLEVKQEDSQFDKAMTFVSNKNIEKPTFENVSYVELKKPSSSEKSDTIENAEKTLQQEKSPQDYKETVDTLKKKIDIILKSMKQGTSSPKELAIELNQVLGQLEGFLANLQNMLKQGNLLTGSLNDKPQLMTSQNISVLQGTIKQIKSLVENLGQTNLSQAQLDQIQKSLKDLTTSLPNDLKQAIEFNKDNSLDTQTSKSKKGEDLNLAEGASKNINDNSNTLLSQRRAEISQEVRQSQMQRNQLESNLSSYNGNGQSQKLTGVKVQSGALNHDGGSFSKQNQSPPPSFGVGGLEGLMQRISMDPQAIFSMNAAEKLNLGKEILNQLGETLKGNIGKTQSKFSFTLNPQELGKVTIHLNMNEEVIKGQIVVENEIVKDLLKDRFKEMETLFNSQGIQLNSLEIHTQSEFESQYGQKEFDRQKDLFNQHKEASQQVKLNREANFENSTTPYQKTIDNIYNNGEFLITI